MSDTPWTPGPWHWDAGIVPPDGPGTYADIYVDGGETIIAGFNDFIPEGRANARLISAAPDMAEALEDAIWALANCAAALSAAGLESTIADPSPKMRAALAKARGQA